MLGPTIGIIDYGKRKPIPSLTSDMEVEDYFLRKLRETAINPVLTVPLLSRNLKGNVSDGRQTGIANGKYPARIDPFTEVKVIHIGTF